MRRFSALPARAVPTLLLLAILASCTAGDPSSGTPEERLAEHALGVPTVVRGSDDAIIGVVGRFDTPAMASIDAVLTAEWFLGEYGDFWGITNVATDLALGERIDGAPGPLGRPTATLIYQRVVGAYDVLGARLTIRVEDGFVTNAMGVIPRELDVATTPTVSDADAIATVLAAVTAGSADTADLVVVSEGLFEGLSTAPSVLAWRVEVSAGFVSETRFVDAASGSLLALVISGSADARNRSVRDRSDLLCGDQMPPLMDAACLAWIQTAPQVYDEAGPVAGTTPSADATTCWNSLGATYDMLQGFGRDGYDGAGGTFDAHVFVKDIEGDGDAMAVYSPRVLLFSRGTATLDITAHEVGHLFLFSEGFVNAGDSSSAIHEAFGDILGAIVDNAMPWTIGDGSRVGIVRNLTGPATLAEVVPGGDPHDNSLVLGHAFYRASDVEMISGRPPIGRQLAGKIYVHMADRYLYPGVTLSYLWLNAWLAGRELASDSASGVTYRDCAAVLHGLFSAGIGSGDRDGDCVPTDVDICPDFYNPDQADGLECLRPFGSCQFTDNLCVNYHSRDDNLRTSCVVSGGVWTEDACVEEEADGACVLYTGTEDVQIEVYYNLLDEAIGAVQCFLVPSENGGPGIFTPTYIRPSL